MPVSARARLPPDIIVIGARMLDILRGDRAIARRNTVICRALKDREVFGLFGDRRCRLDAGRAGADLANALAAEVYAFMGPQAGVVPIAFEILEALKLWYVGGGKAPDGRDEVRRRHHLPPCSVDGPGVGGVVKCDRGDFRPQSDVALEIEPVGNEIQIFPDFGMLGIALAPAPRLLDLLIKGIAVVIALRVATGTWVPVPVPCSSDAFALFKYDSIKAEFVPQLVKLIKAGKAGADDDRVESPAR